MNDQKANKLLSELFEDPEKFSRQGKAYALLEEYFHGLEIESLRLLLRSGNTYIISAGTFILSELGKKACPLIDDCVLLLNNENERVKYEVLETIFLCSTGGNLDLFYHVPWTMTDASAFVRRRAMELTSKAYQDQINAGMEVYLNRTDVDSVIHAEGLSFLLDKKNVQRETIKTFLKSEFTLARKYGVLIAKKAHHLFSDMIELAAGSDDDDVRMFSKEFIAES